MAHFAQLDENNIVQNIIVINNNDCMLDGVENEEVRITKGVVRYTSNFMPPTSFAL